MRPDDEEGRALIDAIDVVLNEVMLRRDNGFYADWLARGEALAVEGEHDSAAGEVRAKKHPHCPPLDPLMRDTARRLEAIVERIGAPRGGPDEVWLNKVVDWELRLYAHRMRQLVSAQDMPADARELITADGFTAYLRRRFPEWVNVEVVRFTLIPGGFSKITILVETRDVRNGTQELAIRAEPPLRFMDAEGLLIAREFPLLQLVHGVGLPVAEPLWLEEDDSHFGMRFMVSRRMPGKIHGTVKGGAGALFEGTFKEIAAILARIHALDLRVHQDAVQQSHLRQWADYPTLPENTAGHMRYWRMHAEIGKIDPSPLIARGLAWLDANVPQEAGRPGLIHGDIALHNILIENGHVSALLDWEVSRIGDPAEDMVTFLTGTQGIVDPDDFRRWYREAGGAHISEYRLRYFRVYNCMKQTIAALIALRRIEDFPSASIYLAVFGLQYMDYVASQMPRLIEEAEAARDM